MVEECRAWFKWVSAKVNVNYAEERQAQSPPYLYPRRQNVRDASSALCVIAYGVDEDDRVFESTKDAT